MKGNIIILVLGLTSLTLSGCATKTKSVVLGGSVGTAVGAGFGQAASRNSKGTAIGAVVGLALGSLIGGKAFEIEKEKLEAKKHVVEIQKRLPKLLKPKIKRILVPDKIEGDQFIERHYIYKIERGATWSR